MLISSEHRRTVQAEPTYVYWDISHCSQIKHSLHVQAIVIKVFRGGPTDSDSISHVLEVGEIEAVCKLVLTTSFQDINLVITKSKALVHKNICPIFGLDYGKGAIPALIVPYCININQYVSQNPSADKLRLVRAVLLFPFCFRH